MTDPPTTRGPSVTWVMIFLDGVRFIDEAIASVVDQRDLDDWELMLVDDGSSDGSTERAEAWAQGDPDRIRLVHHPNRENRGMSASRNLGVAEARAPIVGFLDCDDVLLPGTMRRALDLLDLHPTADVVIGRTLIWFGWTGNDRDGEHDRILPHPDGLVALEPIDAPRLFHAMYGAPGHWMVPAVCGIVIRRDALFRIEGFEAAFAGMFEDQVLYAKIGLGLTVVLDDECYARYRQHEWSACSIDGRTDHWNPWRRNPPRERFIAWLDRYVTERNGSDSTEAGVVRANSARRDSIRRGSVRLAWTARRVIMERLPRPVAERLRRHRSRIDTDH